MYLSSIRVNNKTLIFIKYFIHLHLYIIEINFILLNEINLTKTY